MPVEYQLPAGPEFPPPLPTLGRRGTPLTGPTYPPGWTQEDEQMFQQMSGGVTGGGLGVAGGVRGLGTALRGIAGRTNVPVTPAAPSPQALTRAFEEVANDTAFWENVHNRFIYKVGPEVTNEGVTINREVARRLGVTEEAVRRGWAEVQKGMASPTPGAAGAAPAEQEMAGVLGRVQQGAFKMPPALRALPFMGALAMGGLAANEVVRFLAQAFSSVPQAGPSSSEIEALMHPGTMVGTPTTPSIAPTPTLAQVGTRGLGPATAPSSWETEGLMHPGTMVGMPGTLAQVAGRGLGTVTAQESPLTSVPTVPPIVPRTTLAELAGRAGPGPLGPGETVEVATGQVARAPQAVGGPGTAPGTIPGPAGAMPAGMEDLLRSYAESERGYLALKQKEQQLTEMLAKSRLSGQYEGQETLEAEIERGLQEIQRQLAQYEGERVRGGLELGRRGIESEYRQGMAKLAGTAPARWFE